MQTKTPKHKRKTKAARRVSTIQSKKTKKIIVLYNNVNKYNAFYKSLTKEEKYYLRLYKLNGYVLINQFLFENNTIKTFRIENIQYFKQNISYILLNKDYNPNPNTIFINQPIQDVLINNFTFSLDNIRKYTDIYINHNIIRPINVIDNVFRNKNINRLTKDVILYRGMRFNEKITNKLREGEEITFNNFLSTSLFMDISQGFAPQNMKNGCIFIFSGLDNIPYIFLHNLNNLREPGTNNLFFGTEGEYLLPRGLKFKITRKDITRGMNQYDIKFMKLKKLKNIINDGNFHISLEYLVYYAEYVGIEQTMSVEMPSYYEININ